MCGIFGLIASKANNVPVGILANVTRKLFQLSETRGKDASGIVAVNDEEILIYKEARRAGHMQKTPEFTKVLTLAEKSYKSGNAFVIAGHTRMVTNGSEDNANNNQPVIKSDLVLLHNGIIVNDSNIWQSHPNLLREYDVDTEVFGALLMEEISTGGSIISAMRQAFDMIKGANTFAAIHAGKDIMILGTTNGSLYFWTAPSIGLSLFGSEKYILQRVIRTLSEFVVDEVPLISQVSPSELLKISLKKGTAKICEADTSEVEAARVVRRVIRQVSDALRPSPSRLHRFTNTYAEIERHMHYDLKAAAALRRCSSCLLPETFPFIRFDTEGTCQFCRHHRPKPRLGKTALQVLADKVRRTNGASDCLIPISGGRDSCFGLHYVKRELGLNPVAYTYDWGVVTDLARRNISRLCGELKVEHVLVAADIKRKRDYVRMNVNAWLAKPRLSMVPLFMAGDKGFFYYASSIKKQMELGPILFSMNWLEKTDFKTGFAGVNDTSSNEKTHGLTPFSQFRLASHYAYNFLSNSRYINGSIPDTLFGYISYYLKSKDYVSIFDYLNWDQVEIERTIIDSYEWETSPDTKSTWRIGDGSAPFYNYIYQTMAGFSEHDTFRSNQIREGMIDRASALQYVLEENRPRPESFKWYCDTIGLDAVSALKAINGAKKIYA